MSAGSRDGRQWRGGRGGRDSGGGGQRRGGQSYRGFGERGSGSRGGARGRHGGGGDGDWRGSSDRGRGDRGGRGGRGSFASQSSSRDDRNGAQQLLRPTPLTAEEVEELKAGFPLSLSSASLSPQLAAHAGGCSEAQVGIRHFLSSSPPFTGIIKTRAQDFLVNEIDKQGRVLHLSSLSRIADDEQTAAASSPPADAVAALSALVGAEPAAAFASFVAAEQAKEAAWRSSFPQTRKPAAGEFVFAVELDKTRRTELHAMLKDWSAAVVTDTVDVRSTAQASHAEAGKQEEAGQGGQPAAEQDGDGGAPSPKRQKMDDAKDAGDVQMSGVPAVESSSPSPSPPPAAATDGTAASPTASSSSSSSSSSSMKAVRARLLSLTSKRDMDARDERIWPRHRPPHLHFSLYKENSTTAEALALLASTLRLPHRLFHTAGTKDKRACTTQRVSAFKVSSEKMARVGGEGGGGLPGIKLGDYSYQPLPLTLGALDGNDFCIALRDVQGVQAEEVAAGVQGLQQRGFVNYYGMQRFGTGSVPSHVVGRAMLRGDWKLTVSLLLAVREGEREEVRKAREYLRDTADVLGCLDRMPRSQRVERQLLEAMRDMGVTALSNAVAALPRDLRLMFVHAWQSFVWNEIVNERLDMANDRIIAGDLVLDRKDADADRLETKDEAEPQPAEQEEQQEQEQSIAEEELQAAGAEDEAVALPDSLNVPVHHVTQAEVDAGLYGLHDLVLPLPGTDVLYPLHALRDSYQRLLEREGVTAAMMAVKGDSRLTGAYRRVIERPQRLRWSLHSYDDPRKQLLVTDRDRLYAAKERTGAAGGEEEDAVMAGVRAGWGGDGLRALVLRFSLRSSVYATMLLRELMKISTSAAAHKQLADDSEERWRLREREERGRWRKERDAMDAKAPSQHPTDERQAAVGAAQTSTSDSEPDKTTETAVSQAEVRGAGTT